MDILGELQKEKNNRQVSEKKDILGTLQRQKNESVPGKTTRSGSGYTPVADLNRATNGAGVSSASGILEQAARDVAETLPEARTPRTTRTYWDGTTRERQDRGAMLRGAIGTRYDTEGSIASGVQRGLGTATGAGAAAVGALSRLDYLSSNDRKRIENAQKNLETYTANRDAATNEAERQRWQKLADHAQNEINAYTKGSEAKQQNAAGLADALRGSKERLFREASEGDYAARAGRALETVEKYGDNTYDDNLAGLIGSNYGVGRLSQNSSYAWNEYLNNPTPENRAIAELYDLALSNTGENNADALTPDNGLETWARSIANYAPQFLDQTAARLKGGTAGLLLGSVGAGQAAGSALDMYAIMRGAAFRGLLETGVPEEQAMEMAKDEALISSIIEYADSLAEYAFMGGKDIVKLLMSGGAELATTTAGKSAGRAAAKIIAAYLGNIVQEGEEERSQEAVSIANERRLAGGTTDSGKLGLAQNALDVYWNEGLRGDRESETYQRMAGAAEEGRRVATVFAAIPAGTGYAANRAVNRMSTSRGMDFVSDALDQAERGEVSDLAANRVLNNSFSRDLMQREGGVTLTDDMTKQEQRDAIKQAAARLAGVSEAEPVAVSATNNRTEISEPSTPQRMGESEAREALPLRGVSEQQLDRDLADAARLSVTLGRSGANAFLTAYDRATAASVEPTAAFENFSKVYNAAVRGENAPEVSMPEHLRIAAQGAGENDARTAAQAQYFGENAGLAPNRSGRPRNLSSREARVLDAIGKAAGVQIKFADTMNGANASIENGVLTIAKDADDPVRAAFTHEIVHRVRESAPEAYSTLAQFVVDNMSDERLASAIRARSDTYSDMNYSISDITEETVADAFGRMASEPELLEKIAGVDRTAAQKILDAIDELLRKIKAALSGKEQAQLTANQIEAFRDLQGRGEEMAKALRAALQKVQEQAQTAAVELSGVANASDAKEAGASEIKYSRVIDEETLDWLNKQKTVKAYRAMQVIDGKLYPPMAAKVASEGTSKRQLVEPTELNAWYRSDERPDLVDPKTGKFKLDKANGATIEAAYNPYFHTSATPLNDQFSSAYKRPNLVTVEVEIPESELTSGYKAQYAKDSVGETKWHAGPVASQLKGEKARRVFLSRWAKVNRIVPDAEVAQIVARTLEGENIAVPYKVVTPSLRAELEKAGVQIDTKGEKKAATEGGAARYSRNVDSEYMAAVERGDMDEAQRMVDEAAKAAGYTVKAYHATDSDFTVFNRLELGKNTDDNATNELLAATAHIGHWFNSTDVSQKIFAKKAIRTALQIENPLYTESLDSLVAWIESNVPTDGTAEEIGNLAYKKMREQGYDGVILNDEELGGTSYVVFNSSQAKSADPVTYDDNGNVIPLSERFNTQNSDIRYSRNVDSEGRELTEAQAEYFKDSKVRDDQGRLLALFHQTGEDFTVFDPQHKGAGTSDNQTPFGIFLKSSNKDIGVRGQKQMELYADIKTPLIAKNREDLTYQIRKISPEYEDAEKEYQNLNADYARKTQKVKTDIDNYMKEWRSNNLTASRRALYDDEEYNALSEKEDALIDEWEKKDKEVSFKAKKAITEALKQNGYDGVILQRDSGSFGRETDAYIALFPEQVKNVTNTAPTSNPDIRFSRNVDEKRIFRTPQGVEVVQNPTDSEYAQMRSEVYRAYPWLRETGEPPLRRTFDEDGNVYYWSSADGIHAFVEPYINREFNTRTSQHWKWWEKPDKDDYPIRYSRKSVADAEAREAALLQENDLLREEIKYWKAQLERTPKENVGIVEPEAVKKAARDLISTYGSTIKTEEITEGLQNLYNLMGTGGDENGELSYEAAREIANGIAREIAESALNDTESAYRMYEDLRKFLRTTKITITPEEAKEISDYGDWRKHNMGRIDIARGESSNIDRVYDELSDRWPEYFPGDVISVGDQLQRIADVMDYIYRDRGHNPFDPHMDQAVIDIGNDIMDRFFDLPQAKTFADKQAAKLGGMRIKMSELRQRNEERLRESMAKARADRDAKLREMKDHYAEIAQRRRERRENTEARNKLLHIARRLANKKLPAVNRALLNEYIGDLDLVAKSMTGATLEKLTDLRDWYFDQRDNNPDFIADPHIEKLIERLSKRQIKDLTDEEVRDLTDVLLNIENEIRTQNKLINSKDRHDTYMAGMRAIQDIENSRGIRENAAGTLDKLLINNTLSPVREMHRLTAYADDDPLYVLINELADGQRKQFDYQRRAGERFLKWTEDKKLVERIRGKKAEEIRITGIGKNGPTEVTITPAMRMSLYLHSKNAQNLRHITGGGIRVPDMQLYKRGKLSEAYDRGTTIKLTPSQIQSIVNQMTAEERAFADAASAYFNGMSREAINETSEKLKGYSLAGVENYFPIDTDKSFVKKDFDSLKFDGTLEGMGFLKERINSASPIMLYDMDNVLRRSIEQHAKYYGLAVPVRNFNKVWGVTKASFDEDGNRNGYESSVMQAMREKWGDAGYNYVDKLMSDLQSGHSEQNDFDKLMRKVRSNYAGAVLTLNASVAMKQAASYPTAAAVVGWKPLARALGNIGKVDLNTVNKYTPLLWYRTQGFSTQELGDMARQDKQLPKLLNWVQGMDVLTTRKLWKAAEYYVQGNQDVQRGSEEYYKAVADVYNRIIEETQPNYTTMQRPQILRSNSTLLQSLSMFKTQPFQNFNVLYDALGNFEAKKKAARIDGSAEAQSAYKDAKKRAGWAITSQLAQLAVFAGMTAAWNLFRGKTDNYDDDDEKVTAESVLKRIMHDMLGGAASMVPFGSDVWEFASSIFGNEKYYGFDEVTSSSINDLLKAFSKAGASLGKTWESVSKGEPVNWNAQRLQWDSVVKAVSKTAGVPFENVENLFNAIYRMSAIAAAGKYKGTYAYLRLTKDPSDTGAYYDNLYGAYKNDKTAYEEIYADMTANGFDAGKIKTAMEKRMKKSEGVESVKDLGERYLAPEAQTVYDETLGRMQRSSVWRGASAEQREKAEGLLYDLLAGSSAGDKLREKINGGAGYGLDSAEYILYRLALSMTDEPTESGKYGTYTNAEVEAAIRMVPNLTNVERDYLWTAQGKNAKSAPKW